MICDVDDAFCRPLEESWSLIERKRIEASAETSFAGVTPRSGGHIRV